MSHCILTGLFPWISSSSKTTRLLQTVFDDERLLEDSGTQDEKINREAASLGIDQTCYLPSLTFPRPTTSACSLLDGHRCCLASMLFEAHSPRRCEPPDWTEMVERQYYPNRVTNEATSLKPALPHTRLHGNINTPFISHSSTSILIPTVTHMSQVAHVCHLAPYLLLYPPTLENSLEIPHPCRAHENSRQVATMSLSLSIQQATTSTTKKTFLSLNCAHWQCPEAQQQAGCEAAIPLAPFTNHDSLAQHNNFNPP
ncbi:hypothetical protein PM082_018949 [Marasmius tenuissimus]|nr:hypothetical protein PM082_018949 [Marasmius tenuissimus]